MNPASAGEGARPGQSVYLDHAATTPMLPEAMAAMTEELALTGNPSSLHNAGRRARRSGRGVTRAHRAGLRRAAERGRLHQRRHRGRQSGCQGDVLGTPGRCTSRDRGFSPRRSSITRCWTACSGSASTRARRLTGCRSTAPACSALTCCGPRSSAIPASVAVISVMWANNEVGAVQPVAELAAVAADHGIPFHSDAVQAAGQLPVTFAASGADRADHYRAQDRRPGRGRRAAAWPGAPMTRAGAAWRRPGARRPVWHPRCRRDQGFRGRSRARDGQQGRARGQARLAARST